MEEIKIDNVQIPYSKYEGDKYYPIRYMLESVLLKNKVSLYKNEEYKPYVKKCSIDWSFKGTVPQESNCMNKKGWQLYLTKCKTNKNKSEDKVDRYNLLCEYFDCKNNTIVKQIKTYNKYEKACIDYYMLKNKDARFKKCVNCDREFPVSHKFFTSDGRVRGGLLGTCKCCKGVSLTSGNVYEDLIYTTLGNDAFLSYRKDVIEFYNMYCHKKDFLLNCRSEKEGLSIIKWYYDNKLIADRNLSYEFIKKYFRFRIQPSYYKNKMLNESFSNGECKNKPYLYPNYTLGNIDCKQANLILDNYIADNGIVIDDILKYNHYEHLLKKAKLSQFVFGVKNSVMNTSLQFIVQYYGYKFAGYKFKLRSINYYKNKENRNFDLKWFIEKDLNISITKIPLYVTKYSLNQKARPLYHALSKGYCGESLFNWVNDCYPEEFNINDFEVNPYRAEFDSLEESQVDEYLRKNINRGVLYNGRSNKDVIEIEGMIPDWIIHTYKGCYLVEYFGLYSEDNYQSSDRLIKYHEKMKIKKERYIELEKVGYKYLFIYPEDIRKSFDGLLKKIELIK